jgi:uncharacterized protein
MLDEYIVQLNDKNGMFYQKVKISDNIETEKETGFLYCKNSILGHVGVQAYNGFEVGITDKKVVYVRRNAEDVFDEDSLASIEGKPVTLNHPDEMVTSKNFKKYTVGFVKNVRQDGENIVGDLVINDMDAIEKVLSGELKDLSLGYTAKLVPTHDGELVQKNIVANHVAIVGEGRAKNARIVDEKTVDEGSEDMALFKKKEAEVIVQDEKVVEEEILDETHEEDDEDKKEETTVEDAENKEEGEQKVMKDFNYFISKFNELKVLPKSEFRDAAHKQLNDECQETLGVGLPEIVEIKDNALDKTIGLADNTTVKEEETKKDATIVYAQDEERMFANMYRKMGNKEYARKLADMTYHDVIEMYEKGGKI